VGECEKKDGDRGGTHYQDTTNGGVGPFEAGWARPTGKSMRRMVEGEKE